MANLEAQAAWESVRQLETDELALGGLNGNMNEQARSLLARTEYLNEKKAEKSDIAQGQYRFSTLAAFNAVKASIPANSTVVIDEAGVNQGANTWDGLTLTKSDYDPLTQAKNYVDANPMFKQVAVVAGNNTNNFTTPGMYTLSANLASGQLTNWPQDNAGYHQAGVIFVQGINISGTKLVTQIFFPYISAYEMKVRRQTLSNGTWEASWSTLSTYEKLATIFPKFTDLSANNSSLLSELAQLDFYGKSFTDSEILGSTVYSTNVYYAGLNSIYAKAIDFNKIKARIWNPTAGDIEYRIFMGSVVTSNANGYTVSLENKDNYSFSGVCKSFPASDGGAENSFELDQIISIPKNTPFLIAFKHASMATFRIGYHTALSGNLADRGFILGATNTADWGVTLSATNHASFIQAGFQLLIDLGFSTSGGSSEINATSVVLPPKVYALPGYDCNVYLEHLTLEDHDLYNFDITCTKGWHRKRGWWWKFKADGTEAGTYPITVSSHDKQSGKQLAVASGNVICPSPSAKSGAINILAIGDSLLAAGDITQQLLDMSVSDVMKVNLIGTRGTGLNKHEGRGGWTINDYTTAGRTYFLFTVSGIVTAPAINSTVYTYNGGEFTVQEVNLSDGSGTLLCSYTGLAPSNGSSGTLTKKDGAMVGDSTIPFSNVQSQSGNPFWNGSAITFSNYLGVNSLATPDVVFIQLGVNDTFGFTSDQAVIDFCATAFTKLDTLINSIKAVNSSIKVVVCAPPVYASQDAFGENYACGQTAWRAKRNIVTYNKKLYERYSNSEANLVYVNGSGTAMDTLNNFPYTVRPVNAFNTDTVYMQTNAVHPAKPGYQQIGVSWFAAAKAI